MRVLLFLTALAAGAEALPIRHGVNLTGWFQSDSVGTIPFGRFGAQDFADLTALGVDTVRLPVNFLAYVGPAPAFSLDPRFLSLLDRAVDGLLGAGFTVLLDNHSDPTDARVKPRLQAFLTALWSQMADRYGGRSGKLWFELQNEPHDIVDGAWAQIQAQVLASLREGQGQRTVVLTGAQWGGYDGLLALKPLADPNLVYSFHFYDPFEFTHQGASWAGMSGKTGVRFPPQTRPNAVAEMAATLDRVAAWSRTNAVPVFCGEFGVYNAFSDPADRVTWYQATRSLLEERGLPWTMWDYRDSFGLFVKGSAEVFEQDLNVPMVTALGFHSVPQAKAGPRRVTEGFVLFDDGVGPDLRESSWTTAGKIDLYDTTTPRSGLFSLLLSGVAQYAQASWSFAPLRDLSALRTTAALSLWVRASRPKFSLELRFVSGQGLPWRLSTTVDQRVAPGDGTWHLVTVPLDRFVETGAWDGTWHDPVPKAFRWDSVARFEVVAEQAPLTGVEVNLDAIAVTRTP